jgi:CubicO group peptidase (beta-lactamase class C family)
MKRTLVFVLAALCLAAAPPDLKKAGMDPALLAKIPARMKTFVDRGTISGAVTLVARHGALASLDAVGYQDLENKKPMRADTIFQIMSMTKPITAAGIMMLMEEGRLALSDPVEKYLPDFRGMWVLESRESDRRTLKRPSRLITIRDLLTHTSGVSRPEAIPNVMFTFDRTLAEVATLYSQTPLEFEPGTKWAYSSPGIAVLGRIIEVVSDQPYERFIDERILKPLGMKDSFFFPPADKTGRIAMVYKIEDGKLRRSGSEIIGGAPDNYRRGAKYPCPECGMFSTAEDLQAFYQMMLNGGAYNGRRLLSRQTVELMTAVHTGDLPAGHSPGMGYGLAWAVVREPLGALELLSVGTYGHSGAFGTQGWVDPKLDMIRILLIGRSAGGGNDERNAFFTLAGSAIVE